MCRVDSSTPFEVLVALLFLPLGVLVAWAALRFLAVVTGAVEVLAWL